MRKQRGKPRVFHRSKVAISQRGTTQAADTARCADTAVSKQTANATRTLADNTVPTLTGNSKHTSTAADGQTVHDGSLSSSAQELVYY